MAVGKAKLIFAITLATLIPGLLADIAFFDEVWQKRAEEAKKVTLNSYIPNPEDATDDFNFEVNKWSIFLDILFSISLIINITQCHDISLFLCFFLDTRAHHI